VDGAHVILRVWLPDRPGALGQVASRIGSVRGDIAGVEVVDRGDGVAIDEFALVLPALELVPMLVREVEQVDGVSVEEVRAVERFGDPRLDALAAACRLGECGSPDELDRELVHLSRRELRAGWAALVGPATLVTAGDAPAAAALDALAAGIAASTAVRDGATGPPDLAVGHLAHAGAMLLVGRSDHPFRPRERAQLAALARLGDTLGRLLSRPTVT
jgi:hypothetical protein